MELEQNNILILYLQRWLVRRKGCHVQEPKEDKKSRVFASFSDLREETALANKARRLKGMDA